MAISAEHLVFDGGLSTELIAKGCDINDDPLWSSKLLTTNQYHDVIVDTSKSFLIAGADAIVSCTYQASIPGFKKHLNCSSAEAEEFLRVGARLVKRACQEFSMMLCNSDRVKPLACASLGPYGASLCNGEEYTGNYVEEMSVLELKSWHDDRLSIMAKEDLDLYIFETIPALAEAEALVLLFKEYPKLKFAVLFSCKDNNNICHGEALSDAVKLFNQCEQVVAVGVNCTSPLYISSLLKSIRNVTNKIILLKPNSGELYKNKDWVQCEHANKLSSYVPTWIELGANWIGGCCRTTPQDINDIRKKMYSYL